MKKILIMLLVLMLAATGCTSNDTNDTTDTSITDNDATHVIDNGETDDTTAPEDTEADADDQTNGDTDTEDETSTEYDSYELLSQFIEVYNTDILADGYAFLDENIRHMSQEHSDEAVMMMVEKTMELQYAYGEPLYTPEIQEALAKAFDPESFNLDVDKYDGPAKDLIGDIYNSGMRISTSEGSFYPVIDFNYLKKYSDHLSDEMNSYIHLMGMESEEPSTSDAHLAIDAETLAFRISLAEDHLLNYPEGITYDKVLDAYSLYMNYLVSGLSFTGAYDLQSGKMYDEYVDFYLTFMDVYPETVAAELVGEYVKMLDETDYTLTDEIQEFMYTVSDTAVEKIQTETEK